MKDILNTLIGAILIAFPEDAVKRLIDKALDWVEDEVAGSSNTWDDSLVLPVCAWARKQLNVPDNDDPAEID